MIFSRLVYLSYITILLPQSKGVNHHITINPYKYMLVIGKYIS